MFKVKDKVICTKPRLDKKQVLNAIYTIKNVFSRIGDKTAYYTLEEFNNFEFSGTRFELYTEPFIIQKEEDYYTWLAKR